MRFAVLIEADSDSTEDQEKAVRAALELFRESPLRPLVKLVLVDDITEALVGSLRIVAERAGVLREIDELLYG